MGCALLVDCERSYGIVGRFGLVSLLFDARKSCCSERPV